MMCVFGRDVCVRSLAFYAVFLFGLQCERVVAAVNDALESTHGLIPIQQSQFGMLLAGKFPEYVFVRCTYW